MFKYTSTSILDGMFKEIYEDFFEYEYNDSILHEVMKEHENILKVTKVNKKSKIKRSKK